MNGRPAIASAPCVPGAPQRRGTWFVLSPLPVFASGERSARNPQGADPPQSTSRPELLYEGLPKVLQPPGAKSQRNS